MKRKTLASVAIVPVCLLALVAAVYGQFGGSGMEYDAMDYASDYPMDYGMASDYPMDYGMASDYPTDYGMGRPDPVGQLINEWKAAEEEAERGEIETKLHTTLQKQFTDRLARHESEVEQLEARVRRLREQVDLRRERQEEIVNFRMQQLLREAQGLGWATDPVTTHPGRMGMGMYGPPQGR